MIGKSLTERMSNTGMRGFKRRYPVLAFGTSVSGVPAAGPRRPASPVRKGRTVAPRSGTVILRRDQCSQYQATARICHVRYVLEHTGLVMCLLVNACRGLEPRFGEGGHIGDVGSHCATGCRITMRRSRL
jgi:hypothetical protein